MIKTRGILFVVFTMLFIACNNTNSEKTNKKHFEYILDHKRDITINEELALVSDLDEQVEWHLSEDKILKGSSVNCSFSSTGKKIINLYISNTGELIASTEVNVKEKTYTKVIIEKEQNIEIKGPNKVFVNTMAQFENNASEEVYWEYGNSEKKHGKHLNVKFDKPGHYSIALYLKSNGRLLKKTQLEVENELIEDRNYKTVEALSVAVEKLANTGINTSQKKLIKKKILQDMDSECVIFVKGQKKSPRIYLRDLILQASEYKQVKHKIEWVINEETLKIIKIIAE